MSHIDITQIEDIKTVVSPCCPDNLSTFNLNWVTNVDLGFQPDFCVVREVMFTSSNNATSVNSTAMFVIWSDLVNDNIASFPNTTVGAALGTQWSVVSNPGTVLMIKKPISGLIKFQLYQVDTVTNTINQFKLIPVTKINLLCFLTITLDFIKVKNNHGKNNIHDQMSYR